MSPVIKVIKILPTFDHRWFTCDSLMQLLITSDQKLHEWFQEPRYSWAKRRRFYLLKFLDEPSSFNTSIHVETDVHFDFSKGISKFDDGNLKNRQTITHDERQWKNVYVRSRLHTRFFVRKSIMQTTRSHCLFFFWFCFFFFWRPEMLPSLYPKLWWSSHLQHCFFAVHPPESTEAVCPTSQKPPNQYHCRKERVKLIFSLTNRRYKKIIK